jgi:L-cystine uptake protein TcyP (sodium:dicarboxylate symporter family)
MKLNVSQVSYTAEYLLLIYLNIYHFSIFQSIFLELDNLNPYKWLKNIILALCALAVMFVSNYE